VATKPGTLLVGGPPAGETPRPGAGETPAPPMGTVPHIASTFTAVRRMSSGSRPAIPHSAFERSAGVRPGVGRR